MLLLLYGAEGDIMDFTRLNPVIHSAVIYEKPLKGEECIAYDARILYVISGDVAVTVGDAKLGHLSAGHVLYIPSGIKYKLKGQYLRVALITLDITDEYGASDRIAPARSVDFNPELLHSCEGLSPFDGVIHIEDFESERDTFIGACNLYTSAEGLYLTEISAMMKRILVRLAEAIDEHALPTRMVSALDAYIRENVGDEISNTEIGAIFGYHPFYVSKMLKDRKGVTLRQYIIQYRLKLAKRMLEATAKSINEIAEETGFTDASYFTKTFKSAFGMTPKEYRNTFKDDNI